MIRDGDTALFVSSNDWTRLEHIVPGRYALAAVPGVWLGQADLWAVPRRDRKTRIGRENVDFGTFVGHVYGSVFEVGRGGEVTVSGGALVPDDEGGLAWPPPPRWGRGDRDDRDDSVMVLI